MRTLLLFSVLSLLSAILVAQNPGSAAAVSSEAATAQPRNPARLAAPTPTPAPSKSAPILPPSSETTIDPLLDPKRPKNCQLEISNEQTLNCGSVSVVLYPGTYKQVKIVDGPQDKKATEGTSLRPQANGLGYIRYLSDTKLKIGDTERIGGIDVGIRSQDNLPLRIWYKKMSEVDDITKAFTFIFPPVGLIAGTGAWSSGNILLPETQILFTEARDYYLKTQDPAESPTEITQPAVRLIPATPQNKSGMRSP